MGSDRKWIVLSYIVVSLLLMWVLNKFFLLGVQYFHLRNPLLLGVMSTSAVLSVLVIGGTAVWYFRQPHVDAFTTDVMQEMRKVTWPTRKLVSASTLVVIVSVVIMAVIIGFYDWICARLIGFVLRV